MHLLGALAELVANGPPPMLKTLAAKAGLPPAKAHRYLVSFIRSNVVERDPNTGRYQLGPLARMIGLAAIRGIDVVHAATAHMPHALEAMKQSVALAIWTQHGATVVWVEDYPRPIIVSTRVGEMLPLLTSATGRVFGAWLPSERTAGLLESELREMREFPREGAIMGKGDAERLFDEVRKAGVGWSTGSLNPGVSALSAPIFDFHGNIVGAIASLGPVDIFDSSPDGPLAAILREEAGCISTALGYQGQTPRLSAD